jgi:Protein of unknown function (DUF3352)
MPPACWSMNVNSRKDQLQAQAKTWFETAKKSPLLLPISGSIALIAGGSFAFWALTRSHLAPGTFPTGANVIPQDSLMVLTVSTDPNQWRQLRSFGTTTSQAVLDQTIAQVRDRFLTPNGIEYERDIQPWVGNDASFALLSPQSEAIPTEGAMPSNPAPQPAVLVLPIRDGGKAKEILEQSRASSKLTWNTRKYKDFEIQESQQSSNPIPSPAASQTASQTLSIAAIDNKLLVIANSSRSMDRAIETYKGEKSSPALNQTPGYNDALGQIKTEGSFAKLYMNLPGMAAVSLAQPEKKNNANPTQGWTMNANLTGEGIQFKSLLWLKPDGDRKFSPTDSADTLPDRLPAETMMFTAGGNFKQFWSEYSRDYNSSAIKLLDPTTFKQEFRGALGMDLEQDFTHWMGGPFALSALPAAAGSSPNTPVGLVLMVQATDRRAADKSFTQLDETMKRKYNFQVEPAKIGTQDIVNWNMGGGGNSGISITRGWLDNNVAFLSIGAPVAATFLPKPTTPLTRNSIFQQVLPTQPKLQGGNFFIDLEKASTYKNLPLLRFPDALKVWSDGIRSIGINTSVTSDRTTRYDAIVLLKRGGTPGPLPSPTLATPLGTGIAPSPSPSPTNSPKPKPNPNKKP